MGRARESVGEEAWGFVKGFRYPVQDKGPGTMGMEGFVEGVRGCAETGYTFELGIDGMEGKGTGGVVAVGGGGGVFGEGVCAGEGGGGGGGGGCYWYVRFVLFCFECVGGCRMGVDDAFRVGRRSHVQVKPDMSSDDAVRETRDAMFSEWEERIRHFARFPHTYMKLSGAFSQIAALPSHDDARPWSVTPELRAAKSRIAPWVAAVFRAFGPERIMFGSDWPVCNLGGGGGKVAWRKWRWVVEEVVRDVDLSEGEKRAVWAGTAGRAYRIS